MLLMVLLSEAEEPPATPVRAESGGVLPWRAWASFMFAAAKPKRDDDCADNADADAPPPPAPLPVRGLPAPELEAPRGEPSAEVGSDEKGIRLGSSCSEPTS